MKTFNDFLNENAALKFEKINDQQIHTIKQEIDRNSIRNEINKKYIEKSKMQLKIMDNDFYINGLALEGEEDVVLKCCTIIEVSEEGGYIYYKPLEFTFDMSNNIIKTFNENDRIRNENWKSVQSEILKEYKRF